MDRFSINQRDVAVDFVKVIATLLVLNSHMHVCYKGHFDLATGGGIGDALFFFISGFNLFMGRKSDFVNWYKRRLARIYPTILGVGLVACLIFQDDLTFLQVITAEKYWFIQCILVCYMLLYPIINYQWKLKYCIPISIIIMLLVYFSCYDFSNTMFYGEDTYFRWLLYFTIMLIGGMTYEISKKIEYGWWSIPSFVIAIILWYATNYLTRGTNWTIISYLPLIGTCYFAYSSGKAEWVEKLFTTKICGNLFFIIGNLCLESYLIQKYIFTDALNNIFPLNIPIIVIIVMLVAYTLHILSSIITQIFDSKPFDWKALLIYKK